MANSSKSLLGKVSAIFETKYFLKTKKVHISKKHWGAALSALPLKSLSWLFLVVPFSQTKPWKVRKWRYSQGNTSDSHLLVALCHARISVATEGHSGRLRFYSLTSIGRNPSSDTVPAWESNLTSLDIIVFTLQCCSELSDIMDKKSYLAQGQ